MKESGKLDKFGRPNEQTPAKWNNEYKDFNLSVNGVPSGSSEQQAVEAAPVKEGIPGADSDRTSREDVLNAPAVAPIEEEKVDKKRKREGETAEEKAERKKKKAEKKEKKEKRKSKSKNDSDDSD